MPRGTAIVFGGAGFIGSHLLRHLVESGQFTTIISADIDPEPRFRVEGVEYAIADVRGAIPSTLAHEVSEIYNLAAVHVTPGHEDWEYYWTNVLGALNVCAFAREKSCPLVAFTSSISVYGASEELKDETSPVEPESAYGRSKYLAELIHQAWQAEQPVDRRLVIARPAVIYGYAERGNFTRMAQALKRRMFVFPGRDDTVKACGYVEDIVRSFDFMLRQPEHMLVYNFAHLDRFTAREICLTLSAALGIQSVPPVIPLPLMYFVGWLFEVAGKLGMRTPINRARIAKLNRSTNVYPRELDVRGFQYCYSLSEALSRWQMMSKHGNFD